MKAAYRCARCGRGLLRSYVEDVGNVCQACLANEREAA
jgi:DNA-directed RNA polymerase subunit RPC12/RpoP